jgi:acetylornithine deacetylase/succinyl-diaminopimelate desuccinylase-like protein
MYRLLKTVLEERDPGCHVAPYLVVGFTDAIAYDRLGIETYGFTPIKLPPDLVFSELYHGHDERIPVEGFRWGLETFWQVVERYNAGGA